eukprot:TRINITY_DN1652_c0_g1_i1.p1 TRINITY_DN1652_c0_g1~~TRINITY_DN1652_c0_g1_i1.p1  ORF type:complete len:241 (+),score=16.59 TRINITY_DN1652_c0_g1_i1:347-1069(+)
MGENPFSMTMFAVYFMIIGWLLRWVHLMDPFEYFGYTIKATTYSVFFYSAYSCWGSSTLLTFAIWVEIMHNTKKLKLETLFWKTKVIFASGSIFFFALFVMDIIVLGFIMEQWTIALLFPNLLIILNGIIIATVMIAFYPIYSEVIKTSQMPSLDKAYFFIKVQLVNLVCIILQGGITFSFQFLFDVNSLEFRVTRLGFNFITRLLESILTVCIFMIIIGWLFAIKKKGNTPRTSTVVVL